MCSFTSVVLLQALLAWQYLTQQQKQEAQFLSVVTPEVADALDLSPKQRQKKHVEAIYDLASKQPFASTAPRDALYTACRHMTYEVLGDDMVTPSNIFSQLELLCWTAGFRLV